MSVKTSLQAIEASRNASSKPTDNIANNIKNKLTEKSPAQKRTPPRLLTVVDAVNVSKKMKRIRLGGEALRGFPSNRNGAHIKVFLPKKGQDAPVLPTLSDKGIVWPPSDLKPITRTYSVRRYYPDVNELEIDFVLHGGSTPASGWATNVNVGDKLGIAGPGGPDPLLAPAEKHIITGDLTALPAISALLEDLPPESRGDVFLYIEDSSHKQVLRNNTLLNVHWIEKSYNDDSEYWYKSITESLSYYIEDKNKHTVSAFVAGESTVVVKIRDFLITNLGLRKSHLYAIPYWRRGQDEETYHQERHRIMDERY